jgi:hypothetical protein
LQQPTQDRRNAGVNAMRQVMMALLVASALPGLPAAAGQDDLPGCAATGSMTVTIGGRPALRLSDVANCPPELYDILSSVQIDGQPMVHFKTEKVGKMRCIPSGMLDTLAENKPASTVGETACAEGQ